jgi:hypothetical protein
MMSYPVYFGVRSHSGQVPPAFDPLSLARAKLLKPRQKIAATIPIIWERRDVVIADHAKVAMP